MSAIFSNTLKSQKSQLHQWKHENNGSVVLKVTISHYNYYYTEMEMNYNLKKLGQFFKVVLSHLRKITPN